MLTFLSSGSMKSPNSLFVIMVDCGLRVGFLLLALPISLLYLPTSPPNRSVVGMEVKSIAKENVSINNS